MGMDQDESHEKDIEREIPVPMLPRMVEESRGDAQNERAAFRRADTLRDGRKAR